jgi:hypothetical protein
MLLVPALAVIGQDLDDTAIVSFTASALHETG